MNFRRLYSHPKDKTKGILYDQTILLNNHYASKDYSEKMHRIKLVEEQTGNVFIFLTNNFHLQANEIAQLYKHRWKIEPFFKWIKQHLKIKSFWRHSENAVKTWGMDCYICLCNGGYSKKEVYAIAKPLRDTTGLKHIHL